MKLNIEKINAKAPYKVTPIPNVDFVSFLTDSGVQYAAGFDKDDTTMPITESYQFSIINGNNGPRGIVRGGRMPLPNQRR